MKGQRAEKCTDSLAITVHTKGHPTVGVALFEPNVPGGLGSSSEGGTIGGYDSLAGTFCSGLAQRSFDRVTQTKIYV